MARKHRSKKSKKKRTRRVAKARRKRRAQEEIRRMDNFETMNRFDNLENRIERMEAEADLVNFGRKPTLEEAFDNLYVDNDIETELAALKSSRKEKDSMGE